jgi:hypothetical protein
MRQIINVGLAFLISCTTSERQNDKSYYVESRLSFYDPYDQSFTMHKWIRMPDNIRTAHESLKKLGYTILLSDEDLLKSPCWIPGLDQGVRNKTCKNIMDSLIIHYRDIDAAPKYYNEFWLRRKKEGNDKVVYEVLTELKAELFERRRVDVKEELVNDTIVNLLKLRKSVVTEQAALKNFEYLKSIGLNMSAHNLLYERYDYYDVKWDKEKLDKTLKKDTIKCCPRAVFEDDTK